MDWTNRGGQAPQPNSGQQSAPEGAPSAPSAPAASRKKTREKSSLWVKITKLTFIILLFSATILAIALIGYLVRGSKNKESTYVDSSKMQAVFLNGGQVYFGNITSLNTNYIRLSNIYYLRVNQQVQPGQTQTNSNDVSLVKLGCELHGPTDEMLINREQVIFWENLKTDGQVGKAVAEYVKQNPKGQQCTTPSSQSNTNTTTTPKQ